MVEYIQPILILVLIGLIIWRDIHFSKTVDSLTNKILSRDLSEYVRVTKELKQPEEQKQEKRKRVVDPVLGAQF